MCVCVCVCVSSAIGEKICHHMENKFIIILDISIMLSSSHVQCKVEKSKITFCIITTGVLNPRKGKYNIILIYQSTFWQEIDLSITTFRHIAPGLSFVSHQESGLDMSCSNKSIKNVFDF